MLGLYYVHKDFGDINAGTSLIHKSFIKILWTTVFGTLLMSASIQLFSRWSIFKSFHGFFRLFIISFGLWRVPRALVVIDGLLPHPLTLKSLVLRHQVISVGLLKLFKCICNIHGQFDTKFYFIPLLYTLRHHYSKHSLARSKIAFHAENSCLDYSPQVADKRGLLFLKLPY